jgi:hypothetical protein
MNAEIAEALEPGIAELARRAERQARKLLLAERLTRVARQEEMAPPDDDGASLPGIAGLRQRRQSAGEDPLAAVELVDLGSALVWQPAHTGLAELARRRAMLPPPTPDAPREVLCRFRFKKLESGGVTAHVDRVDRRLAELPDDVPARLRQWDGESWGEPNLPPGARRLLLVVPGLFATPQFIMSQLERSDAGRRFLSEAEQWYDAILAFYYPLLRVGPATNALHLMTCLGSREIEVHVIAHGSGGLVTRWWLDALRPPNVTSASAVYVGSPLLGTPLCAPTNLLWAASLLTGLSAGLLERGAAERSGERGLIAGSYDGAADHLLRITLALLRVAASTSASAVNFSNLESACALLPGWAEQAPPTHSPQIAALRGVPSGPHRRYLYVGSEFPERDDEWEFASILATPGGGARGAGRGGFADLNSRLLLRREDGSALVGERNDLLVDTSAMDSIPTYSPNGRLVLRPEAGVHHMSYFEHAQVAEGLLACFQLGASVARPPSPTW